MRYTSFDTFYVSANHKPVYGLPIGTSNHDNDVYRLLNQSSKHVIKSSDVICLNKTYGEWIKSKENLSKVDDDIPDTDLEIGTSMNSVEHLENLMIRPDQSKISRPCERVKKLVFEMCSALD
jgi:hypothetical protein